MSLGFTGANTAWAVGEAGTVIHTTDGGTSWTRASTPATATLTSAAFTGPFTGWAVGEHGTIVHAFRTGGPDLFGRVAGVVTDAITGKPVSGASVQIGSRPGVPTATDCSFIVARVAPGTCTVTVTSPRYITSSKAGVVITAGATAFVGLKPTPRTATMLTKPTASWDTTASMRFVSLSATLSPAAAATSTTSAMYFSHYEQETVTKKVGGKKKKVKVWYWRQRYRITPTASGTGRLLVRVTLAPGKWRAYATCSGSWKYLPTTSATVSFSVP